MRIFSRSKRGKTSPQLHIWDLFGLKLVRAPKLAVFWLALGLLGCSNVEILNFDQESSLVCPTARLIPEASNITRFKAGPGRDITDILYDGEFVTLAGDCTLQDNTIFAEIFTGISLSRGPALRGEQIESAIIVAVTDDTRKVLDRQRFPITLRFENNVPARQHTESLYIKIPIAPGKLPEDYIIFLGFALTPSEVEANRQELGL